MAERRKRVGGRSDGLEGLRALSQRAPVESRGTERAVANEAGLRALGEQMAGRARPRHRGRRILVISVSCVLVLVLAGAGYLYYLTHDLNRVNVKGLHSAFTSGAEAGTENILMLGSTSRCALKVQNLAYGLCSAGVNGVNSDVIMVLHVNPATHALGIISIPRDLFIPNARSTGANKVDAGLFQGMSQVVASVEEDFGIPIQHAVSLNFDQFANIVNALGGINMSFPESVFDRESGLNVQAASCVHLDGVQALQVVRARHLQYRGDSTTEYAAYWPQEAQSDLARIVRDHEFLRVLASAMAKRGLGNPLSDISLINSVKSDITFDQSWAVTDMASLVVDYHAVNINAVPQLTLPVSLVTDPDGGSGGSLIYNGGSYGQVEFPSEPQDQSTIDQVLGIKPTINSMTGTALPSPSSVSVSVVNGTGAADQAGTTSSSLSALGFNMVGVGDANPTGDVSETVVYYGSRDTSSVAAAELVLHSLSGSVVMAYDPSMVTDGAQVTVVTGSQFSVNPPPASSATAPTSGSGSTSSGSSSGGTSSSAIATPTQAQNGLAPWDPRACSAHATPTAPVPNPVG
ncbi:MAG TPA: LCP family protein [Acidimicrobiales bacterium]|nr:LCP family protein [Acidimicrobiales bacterium]